MTAKINREYRNSQAFKPSENEDLIVEGYATTFNDSYELTDGFFERIDADALKRADMSDVIFQENHEGTVLARQRNNTLEIIPDEHGLFIRANLSGSQKGRDLYEQIKNGLVDRMSWGFTVAEDGWEYDKKTRTATITGVKKIYDVSAVSIPANDGTEIKARSYLDGVIEDIDGVIDEDKQQEMVQSLKEVEMRKRLALSLKLSKEGRINNEF